MHGQNNRPLNGTGASGLSKPGLRIYAFSHSYIFIPCPSHDILQSYTVESVDGCEQTVAQF